MLTDAQGNPLVDQAALPPPQTMSNIELTALLSGILRLLMLTHGPNAIGVVLAQAEAVEAALSGAATDAPPHTDDDIARWESEEES